MYAFSILKSRIRKINTVYLKFLHNTNKYRIQEKLNEQYTTKYRPK